VGKFFVQNFGCRATQADGAALETLLAAKGFEAAGERAAASGGEAYAQEEPEPALVEQRRVSSDEQLGRNDPCWCGSGKKFKRCHGA